MSDYINNISLEYFSRDNLDAVGLDRHDFMNVSVWQLKAALEEAYQQGKATTGEIL